MHLENIIHLKLNPEVNLGIYLHSQHRFSNILLIMLELLPFPTIYYLLYRV